MAETVNEWLDEFMSDMVEKFEAHNDHSEYQNDFSLNGSYDNLKHTDYDRLLYELDMHFSKYHYLGRHKKTVSEADALVNLANVCFLLYVRLKKNPKGGDNHE